MTENTFNVVNLAAALFKEGIEARFNGEPVKWNEEVDIPDLVMIPDNWYRKAIRLRASLMIEDALYFILEGSDFSLTFHPYLMNYTTEGKRLNPATHIMLQNAGWRRVD